MNLTLAVCLTPCRTVTTTRMAPILIAQGLRELQGVLSSVNQVSDICIIVWLSFTLIIIVTNKVMTHLMRKINIMEKGVTLYLQECRKFRQR